MVESHWPFKKLALAVLTDQANARLGPYYTNLSHRLIGFNNGL